MSMLYGSEILEVSSDEKIRKLYRIDDVDGG